MPPRKRTLKPVPDAAAEPKGITPKIEATLAALELRPEDAGIAELALRYARTIDRAEAIAARAAQIPFDPDSADEVKRLAQRVSAQVTMSDLGPKLQAALDALGATPKARAASPRPSKPGTSALAGLRGGA